MEIPVLRRGKDGGAGREGLLIILKVDELSSKHGKGAAVFLKIIRT